MPAPEVAPWAAEVEHLKTAPLAVLVARYQELFAEPPRARHRVFLLRRVAWRLQANLYGGLADRARLRALAIADDRELRLTAPPTRAVAGSAATPPRDARLPMPGAVLKRLYRGRNIEVKVLLDGFEYEGQPFASLSGVAERVTGTRWNGFVFFGLQARKHAA
jgi:hypothetical protein